MVSRLEDSGEYYSFLQKLGFEEIKHDLSGGIPRLILAWSSREEMDLNARTSAFDERVKVLDPGASSLYVRT